MSTEIILVGDRVRCGKPCWKPGEKCCFVIFQENPDDSPHLRCLHHAAHKLANLPLENIFLNQQPRCITPGSDEVVAATKQPIIRIIST